MLDMPSPAGKLNKYRPLNLSPTGIRPCEIMWFKLSKIKDAQVKISLHIPMVHGMLIKNGSRTMLI